MNDSSRAQDQESKPKLGLMFVIYQIIAIFVTNRSAPILTASALNFFRLFGGHYTRAEYNWILTGTPYFPVQTGLGLILGWVLGRHLRDRSMVWVWVLPFAVLCYAFVTIPALNPTITPSELTAGVGQSRLVHYFGWGCQSVNHCVDQEVFTAPFYATAAYSIAAFAAEELTENTIPATIPEFSFVLSVGIILLVSAIYDFGLSVRRVEWHWMFLAISGVPAAMGAYLILLAFRIRMIASQTEPD
jgi:hypothetical protein